MEIHIVLGLLCVTASCSIFIGHAAGYARGRSVGYKRGVEETRALWKLRLNTMYGKQAEKMGDW